MGNKAVEISNGIVQRIRIPKKLEQHPFELTGNRGC